MVRKIRSRWVCSLEGYGDLGVGGTSSSIGSCFGRDEEASSVFRRSQNSNRQYYEKVFGSHDLLEFSKIMVGKIIFMAREIIRLRKVVSKRKPY
ncbi:hypothetical protein RhiirA1_470248 [Rhizophagus irregularis]|uniref:Uncharacterized protein n=1 Tax=Rhizophagus irregularis TaxID=588596 RepID=A0A2N0R6H5_9GLOM|nr:hypothetical protein RhiirA1_470248 [Rhizophagus irregularis]